MSDVSTRALLEAGVAAALAAAEVIRAGATELASLEWQVKRPADFVTKVDTDAEDRIRELLGLRVPHAAVIGEELSPNAVPAGVTFVVDPLDGTTNFLHGYPTYSVSIAALTDGQLAAGVVLDVTRGDLYTAERGRGAWRNGEAIRVSAIAEPSRALIGTGFPFKHPHLVDEYVDQFRRLIGSTADIRRAGSAAIDLADVASGRFDAFWELMLAPWDVAAGLLLVREAGGVVTDLAGRDAAVGHGAIVAGNPALHGWLLARLNGG